MTLDALLAEVERLDKEATPSPWFPWFVTEDAGRGVGPTVQVGSGWLFGPAPKGTMSDAQLTSKYRAAAPILARMLREAVEALYAGANLVNGPAECHAALSRLDAMAGEVDA